MNLHKKALLVSQTANHKYSEDSMMDKFDSIYRQEKERDHWVTLLVNSTGGFADIDWGSALAMLSVYISENLGNFEETTSPVELKEPCNKETQSSVRSQKFPTC